MQEISMIVLEEIDRSSQDLHFFFVFNISGLRSELSRLWAESQAYNIILKNQYSIVKDLRVL